MQKYFIHDGRKQLGPFSAAELTKRRITASTPVFTQVLKCYMPAAEIPELEDMFKSGIALKESKKSASLSRKWIIASAALVLILISIVIFKLQEEIQETVDVSSPVAATRQTASTAQSESVDPSQYLRIRGKMHNNLAGKKIIKGKITNLASFAGYKDLQMAVTFLSATQKELQTQLFTVNNVVTPNNEISFRDVFNAPGETEGFRLKIVSAVPAY